MCAQGSPTRGASHVARRNLDRDRREAPVEDARSLVLPAPSAALPRDLAPDPLARLRPPSTLSLGTWPCVEKRPRRVKGENSVGHCNDLISSTSCSKRKRACVLLCWGTSRGRRWRFWGVVEAWCVFGALAAALSPPSPRHRAPPLARTFQIPLFAMLYHRWPPTSPTERLVHHAHSLLGVAEQGRPVPIHAQLTSGKCACCRAPEPWRRCGSSCD